MVPCPVATLAAQRTGSMPAAKPLGWYAGGAGKSLLTFAVEEEAPWAQVVL